MTAILDSLRANALPWLALLADVAAKGLIVLVAAAGASWALRRKSAAARHMVWTVSVIGVLFLPVLSVALPHWQMPLLPHWAKPVTQVAALSPKAMVAPPTEPTVAPTAVFQAAPPPAIPSPAPTAAHNSPVRPAPAAPRPAKTPIPWSVWILLAWAGGVLLFALPLAVGTVTVWLLVRRSRRITDGPWSDLLNQLRADMGITRPVSLRQAVSSNIPITCGIVCATIVLPADADQWPAERREVVLLHELAHVERHDCLTQLLARVARVLYWFNPMVHLAGRMLRIERERACDDLVLTSGHKASDYASHLLEIVRTHRSVWCPSLAAVAMAGHSQIEGRLLAILDGNRNRRAMTRLGAVFAVILISGVVFPLGILKATPAGDKSGGSVATQPTSRPSAATPAGSADPTSQSASLPATQLVTQLTVKNDAPTRWRFWPAWEDSSPLPEEVNFRVPLGAIGSIVDWARKQNVDAIAGSWQKMPAIWPVDCMTARVYPEWWSSANNRVDEAKALLKDAKPEVMVSFGPNTTYLYRTRNGAIGILQFTSVSADGQSATARYRIVRPGPATTQPAEPPRLSEADPIRDQQEMRRRLSQISNTLEFNNVPFGQVMRFMHDATGITFAVDWADVARAGVLEDKPLIHLRLRNMTSEEALQRILKQAGGDIPLGYSFSKYWVYIATQETLDKQKGPAPTDNRPAETEADRQLQDRLELVQSHIRLDKTRLADAMEMMHNVIGGRINVDWEALKTYGVTPDTPISLSLEKTTSASSLEQILAQAHSLGVLRYVVRDGSILVTTLEALHKDSPYYVHGTITGPDGKGMAGVLVVADTGYGRLINSGLGVSDAQGRYTLHFSPGLHSIKKGHEGEVIPQHLIIQPLRAGYTEKNDARQGDLFMAERMPVPEDTSGKRPDQIVLPNKPIQVDFVMMPLGGHAR